MKIDMTLFFIQSSILMANRSLSFFYDILFSTFFCIVTVLKISVEYKYAG
jgi:hypothetical protein